MANQPKAPRKLPTRRCVGCGEHFPKNALIRVVRSPEGKVSVDPTGHAPGRGCYFCREEQCLAKCQKSRAIARAFKCEVDKAIYEEVLAYAAE